MMSIPIIVVQGVLGLLFLLIGSMTTVGMKMFVENFRRFGYPQWFRIVTGSLEALGGIGLLIGIWLPWLAELASAGLTLVMLGAILTQLRTRDPLKKISLAIVLGALASLVAVSYWSTFLHLVVRQNESVPDKRCHAQIWCLRQKMSRNVEGKISRSQSALEQDCQNFCTNSREAGGLPLTAIAKRAARLSFQMLIFHESGSSPNTPCSSSERGSSVYFAIYCAC